MFSYVWQGGALRKNIGFLRFGTGVPLEKQMVFHVLARGIFGKTRVFLGGRRAILRKTLVLHGFAKRPPLKFICSARGLPQKNTGFHGAWKLKGRKLPFKKPREQPNGEKPL